MVFIIYVFLDTKAEDPDVQQSELEEDTHGTSTANNPQMKS